jgi:glucose/arabinose dehydrogenase
MRKHILIVVAIVVLLLVGGGIWATRPDRAVLSVDDGSGRTPRLSQIRKQTIPTVRIADVVGWKDGATPVAAAGLRVNAFASGFDHPRWLYRLPNGDVLVAETNSPPRKGGGFTGWVMGLLMGKAGAGVPSANRITLVRDANGDGVAEARTPFLSGLNSPFGMALVGEWLYVANTDALVRYPFRVGQTKITAAPEKVIALPGGGNHWARNVIANPDGDTLFVTVGSASNIAENGLDAEKNRALILEVDPRTKTSRIYAAGLRNPNGLAIEPNSRKLWTVVNERDMLGSDGPPDYMTRVEFGGFYGWPWNYWGGHVDKRVQPERPDLLEYTARPDYGLGPHTASLGLAFAGDARLGRRFSDGAFIGQHGSWNRVPVSGYKVVYVPFGPHGLPAPGAKPVDILTGFLNADGDAQGRPVGVITDRTGALLVADDVGNVIWRVSAAAR